MLKRPILFVVLIGSALGQTPANPSSAGDQNLQPVPGAPMQGPGQPATPAGDDLAQMRIDLDRMDSLNSNMSSEIEFLRDQNLQILLRTNAQMWTILIRDLRRQIDRDQQRRSTPAPAAPSPAPEPSPR
jgi:hypothetical protein